MGRPSRGPPPGLTAEQREEWLLCQRDPIHFIRQHVQIEDVDTRQWIPFDLWPEQEQAFLAWRESKRTIVLKARQQGFSWLADADALHEMVFRAIAVVLLFSKTDREAMDLIARRLTPMYHRLPPWMKPGIMGRPSSHGLALVNGSRAMAFPTNAGQSYSATLVVLDEADKIAGKTALDDLLAAVKPTVDSGGRLLLISTVEKSQPTSRFKAIYRAGDAGGYKALFYPWSMRPGRTTEWYEQQKAQCMATNGCLDMLHQEYPSTAEDALAPNELDKRIPPQWLAQCYQPEKPLDLSGPSLQHLTSPAPSLPQLRIYRVPLPGRKYVVAGDPAEGNPNSDPSALCVLDRDTQEQVAAMAHQFEPAVFASHVAAVALWYNDASVMIERNNHGHAVLLWLRDNSQVFRLKGHDKVVGWLTNSKGKALMYDHCAEKLRDKQTVIHDQTTYLELQSIEGSSLSAPQKLHDDAAIAFALALEGCDRAPRGIVGIY